MPPLRVLITGSRNWSHPDAIHLALNDVWAEHGRPEGAQLLSGHCPTGADAIAEAYWRTLGLELLPYPADWLTHDENCYHRPSADPRRPCPAAGPRRNAAMVAAGADLCVAFPQDRSAGTWGCVRLAAAAGIPVRVYASDGTWQRWDGP